MSEQLIEVWAIVELMGHVKMAGRVTEEEHFGTKMGRIDIPSPDGEGFVTQWFGGASIYRVTPISEHAARVFAANNRPQPIHRWELLLRAGNDSERWEEEE